MKIKFSGFLILAALALTAFTLPEMSNENQSSDPREIMEKMVASIKETKTMKFTLERKERFGSDYVKGKLDAKVQVSPRKVYVFNHFPDNGSEVLWIQGKNNGKAKVNPNKFPFVNLNLDPYGGLMMNKQHHTIHELGFEYFQLIIESSFDKYGDKFDEYVSYNGTTVWDGRKCHIVQIDFPGFTYEPYTVQSGENLFKIGRKKVVSEMLIMEKNKSVSGFNDVSSGQTIQIPNVFSKKSILYIDAENYLPIVQEVHDEKGMFERYEYHNLKKNPSFSADEFTEDYADYDF